jgi:hypothetical protein
MNMSYTTSDRINYPPTMWKRRELSTKALDTRFQVNFQLNPQLHAFVYVEIWLYFDLCITLCTI